MSSYKGSVFVSKSLGDEPPKVMSSQGFARVQFGSDGWDGTGEVALLGPLDVMAEALSSALTDVQAFMDAREG